MDRNDFTSTLREVSEIVRTSPFPMSDKEILGYFEDMELNESQKAMVLDYVRTDHRDENVPKKDDESGDSGRTDGYGAGGTDGYGTDDESDGDSKTGNEDEEDSFRNDKDAPVKALDMYTEELSNLDVIGADELDILYEKLSEGDASVIDGLCKSWLGEVVGIAKKECGDRVAVDDAISEGNMALVIKLNELLGKPRDLKIVSGIRVAVEESVRNYVSAELGESNEEDAILGKVTLVNAAINHLKEEDGKSPTPEQLAEYTHMDTGELERVLRIIRTQR